MVNLDDYRDVETFVVCQKEWAKLGDLMWFLVIGYTYLVARAVATPTEWVEHLCVFYQNSSIMVLGQISGRNGILHRYV